MAAIGARIIIAIVPIAPRPLLLSRCPPPNNIPNCASIEIAPAMVAVIVMVSVSWFLIWASSWASTPAISSRDSIRSSPVVTATAACSGLRQVAHQTHEIGRGGFVDFMRVVHREHEPIRVPIGGEIHAGRDEESNHRAARATNQITDAD